MDDGKKIPPDGVLAEGVLKESDMSLTEGVEEAQAIKDAKSAPNPAEHRADPDYMEPTTVTQYEEMHAALCRAANGIEDSVSRQRKLLITYLIGRVRVLEATLLPFCVTGTMFSNAAMNLAALGQGDQPPGGTWMSNPPEGIQLQPNAHFFFNAIDAVGRGRTEEHLSAIFRRVQQANELEAAKQNHVDAGGTVH